MSKLDSQYNAPGDDGWYDENFRSVLEDHMTILRKNSVTKVVQPIDLIKYKFDLYGLYRQYGVPDYLHFTVMRVNEGTDPTSVDPAMTGFLLPDPSTVRQIYQHFNTISL